jgi:hypothetical protein
MWKFSFKNCDQILRGTFEWLELSHNVISPRVITFTHFSIFFSQVHIFGISIWAFINVGLLVHCPPHYPHLTNCIILHYNLTM